MQGGGYGGWRWGLRLGQCCYEVGGEVMGQLCGGELFEERGWEDVSGFVGGESGAGGGDGGGPGAAWWGSVRGVRGWRVGGGGTFRIGRIRGGRGEGLGGGVG